MPVWHDRIKFSRTSHVCSEGISPSPTTVDVCRFVKQGTWPILQNSQQILRYVKGERNFVADALSRPSVSAIGSASVINYKVFSEDQALEAEFTQLRH